MSDIELILRFFALSHYDRMDMKFKDYLSDFMDARNKEYVQNPGIEQGDREIFLKTIENCWTAFGDAAFRKDPQAKKSAPLADAVMIALSAYPTETVQQKAQSIRASIKGLLDNNDEFRKAFGTGTNGKGDPHADRIGTESCRGCCRAVTIEALCRRLSPISKPRSVASEILRLTSTHTPSQRWQTRRFRPVTKRPCARHPSFSVVFWNPF
jgi:hypothetical protein